MDKKTRKAAIEKRAPSEGSDMESQMKMEDAANGLQNEPMPAPDSGSMGGDPKAVVADMVTALTEMGGGLDADDQKLVAQAIALLQQVATPESEESTASAGPTSDGANYSDQKGGTPVNAGM